MAGLTLHYLEHSRAQRILFLLEELQVPYDIKVYQRLVPSGMAPPELVEVHKLGKSPVITDGDFVIPESGTIVEYLIEKYGQGKIDNPTFRDTEKIWIDNKYWTHFAEGTLQPRLANRRILSASPAYKEVDDIYVEPELKNCAELIEHHLKTLPPNSTWFLGGPNATSADFMMVFAMEVLIDRAPTHVGPLTKAYVKELQDRPAYKRGLERGGPYKFVLQ
ncbi:glutathione S-transferase [Flagelloscypha sp. PMI_526]|nr:glutathione S-transferase [Flagelloscypha sp. PMI_526]